MDTDPREAFGDNSEWVPTTEQICQKLVDYCLCPAGTVYVGEDAVEGSDHGHTACYFVGWAIKRLRALAAADAVDDGWVYEECPGDEAGYVKGQLRGGRGVVTDAQGEPLYRRVRRSVTPSETPQHSTACSMNAIAKGGTADCICWVRDQALAAIAAAVEESERQRDGILADDPDDVGPIMYGDGPGFYWRHAMIPGEARPWVLCSDVAKFIRGWADHLGCEECAEAMRTTADELEVEWISWASEHYVEHPQEDD